MSEEKYRILILKSKDNVAVALQDIPPNTEITVSVSQEIPTKITIKEKIPFGHKFAVKAIKKGDDILKYGEVIGRAIRDIEEGEHVHVHNLEGTRGRGDKIENN